MYSPLQTLPEIIGQTLAADISPIRNFLFTNPSEPLIATGSGGSETAGELAALLYGARGGVATAVSPYTLHSISDATLKTAKLLLLSKSGHNNDIVFATRRGLKVNPGKTSAIIFSEDNRNDARKCFLRAKSDKCFIVPIKGVRDGFVSTGTSLAYFALLTRVFQQDVDLAKYKEVPDSAFTICTNDGLPVSVEALSSVKNYIVLHGNWGRPVANNLEGKLVECGLASAGVYDYRNYCHGRFIFTSNHLKDSALVLMVSPREKDLVRRIRSFLPASAIVILIETKYNAPEATLDLLIRSTEFFRSVCDCCLIKPHCPANPGGIDKRVPISIPFKEEMKANGPLSL